MRKFGLLSLIAFTAMVGTFLPGCGDDETTNPNVDKASVKFVHAAAGVQGVDIKFGNESWASNRVFGDLTTYLSTTAGSSEVKLLTTGTSTALATKTFNIEKDKNYTLFAVADNGGTADLVLFTDDLEAPEAGKAHIRVAHMMPDGPAAIKVAIEQKGPFATNVAFKDNTQDFVDIDAGATNFRVQDNGVSGGGGGGSPPLLEKAFQIDAGKIYTLVIMGKLADETAEMRLIPHN